MRMTRDEAIKNITMWMYATSDLPPKQVAEALDLAIAALRPVSREQVEKVFPGCPGCDSVTSKWEIKFCPFCGKPRTDEAVDIVMRRLEALKDGKGD